MGSLSARDDAVLAAIFNPDQPFEKPAVPSDIEPSLSPERQPTAEEAEAIALEAKGVAKAESGDIQGAIEILSQAIEVCPNTTHSAGTIQGLGGYPVSFSWTLCYDTQAHPGHASAYNNRAQAYRLQRDEDRALEDLNRCLACDNLPVTVERQALAQVYLCLFVVWWGGARPSSWAEQSPTEANGDSEGIKWSF